MSELPLINEHKSPDLKIGLRKCYLAHYISLGKSSILPVQVKIRLKIVQNFTVANKHYSQHKLDLEYSGFDPKLIFMKMLCMSNEHVKTRIKNI